MKAADIRPITELKNRTAGLVREVYDHGRSIVITQNGSAKVVVMDVKLYDEIHEALAMLKVIAQSQADFDHGRSVSRRQAFGRARAAVARAKRGG